MPRHFDNSGPPPLVPGILTASASKIMEVVGEMLRPRAAFQSKTISFYLAHKAVLWRRRLAEIELRRDRPPNALHGRYIRRIIMDKLRAARLESEGHMDKVVQFGQNARLKLWGYEKQHETAAARAQ